MQVSCPLFLTTGPLHCFEIRHSIFTSFVSSALYFFHFCWLVQPPTLTHSHSWHYQRVQGQGGSPLPFPIPRQPSIDADIPYTVCVLRAALSRPRARAELGQSYRSWLTWRMLGCVLASPFRLSAHCRLLHAAMRPRDRDLVGGRGGALGLVFLSRVSRRHGCGQE